jgi:hypothetical protein
VVVLLERAGNVVQRCRSGLRLLERIVVSGALPYVVEVQLRLGASVFVCLGRTSACRVLRLLFQHFFGCLHLVCGPLFCALLDQHDGCARYTVALFVGYAMRSRMRSLICSFNRSRARGGMPK